MVGPTAEIGAGDMPDMFENLVRTRKSVRAFLPEPVPEDRIRALLEIARWTPSNCNTQPWIVHIASGETVETLRRILLEDALTNGYSRDFPYTPEDYPAALHARMIDHVTAQQLALGISREDGAAREKLRASNLGFFGAPHVALLYLPAFAQEREAADLGMFAPTFLVALEANGLAGIPQTSVGSYAAPMRRILNPVEGHKLMFAISFGWEDKGARAARLVQDRAELDDFVTFHR